MTNIKQDRSQTLLSGIFKNIDGVDIPVRYMDNQVSSITCDSRQVMEGSLFAAFKGTAVDGSQFVDDAVRAGAKFILCDNDAFIKEYENICIIKHGNPRLVFSLLAANFYPRQPENIVAVTGTNGKTSTVHFCRQIWNLVGKKSACLGTTGVVVSDEDLACSHSQNLTTPDPVTMHQVLSKLAEDGVNYLALEASSHGLDQYRLDGIKIKSAAFTNLTRDHLDYHKNFENYLNAKLRLFSDLLVSGSDAFINADIDEYGKIKEVCKSKGHKVKSFGRNGDYIKIKNLEIEGCGQLVSFSLSGKDYKVKIGLVGEFQVSNLLCAAGLVISSGIEADDVISVLDKVVSVPGRMQQVGDHGVYVDYAHTPDALEKALKVLRKHTEGRLHVVFGCGGNRDKGKRPLMGKIACDLADQVIVTDDNPRDEDASQIRAEILSACDANVLNIGDRKAAIKAAVDNMATGDILLIAGKGHEKTQKVKDQLHPFDDVKVAEEALLNLV